MNKPFIIYKEIYGVFSSFDSNLGITGKVFKQLMTKKTPNSTKSYGVQTICGDDT